MSELLTLALSCLRVGTFVFGGGLVFIPLMQADVVIRYGWLTQQEFLDAVAMGQMTPGPVLVTATFVGYKVAGVLGACVATGCVFLPSFLMTLVATHYVTRLQTNARLQDFLWGVRAAVVGLVVAALIGLAQAGLGSAWQVGLALVAVALLVTKKIDAGVLIVGSGLLGVCLLPWTGRG